MSAKRHVVLLVNPNTNTATTTMMRDLAAAELEGVQLAAAGLVGTGLEVVGLTALQGPAMLIDPESLAASAAHVHEAVRSYLAGPQGPDVVAVIISAMGDPGWQELSDEMTVPVVGMGEAAIVAASEDGRRFGMATSTPLLAPSLIRLVAAHGRSAHFCGVQLTALDPLVLAAHPQQQFAELRQAVVESAAAGAQAVIIAGGPLSETARRISAENMAVIIEPIPSACRLVLQKLRSRPPYFGD